MHIPFWHVHGANPTAFLLLLLYEFYFDSSLSDYVLFSLSFNTSRFKFLYSSLCFLTLPCFYGTCSNLSSQKCSRTEGTDILTARCVHVPYCPCCFLLRAAHVSGPHFHDISSTSHPPSFHAASVLAS